MRTRVQAAIDRGSSDSANPISRNGSTSRVKRKIALENSPTVRSLDWIRAAPITTSRMLASDGITSSSPSNQLRIRIAFSR